MAKIFLVLNSEGAEVKEILSSSNYELKEYNPSEEITNQVNNFRPDIVLIQSSIENLESSLRQLKPLAKTHNLQTLLLIDGDVQVEYLNMAEGFIEMPIKKDVLLSTIRSHFKTKESLDRLNENNKELSRSLYQINVLYNTSSQFAGTLNTKNLYEIMIEAIDRTLSFDVCAVLLFDTSQKPVFNLHCIHAPAQNLVDALKIRSILNYENIVDENTSFKSSSFDDIEVIQKVKQKLSNVVYGLETISYDSLFAPIKVGDEIFGIIELFRKTPFAKEDVTCFQAITHQVALPLRSAKLYEQISNTNKKLEKLERLKSEFISIVSHELRTPLTPINNSLEIVLSGQAGAITPDVENFVSMAKRNIQRLSGIIEDLLDLSMIQAGKLDFKYKKADITPSLELLKNTFEQVASEKNIKINLEIKDKLPEIYADIRRIEQIFSNLVSNSLKFTPNDGQINVIAEIVDAEAIEKEKLIMPKTVLYGKYIKASVEDNGIGIKAEDIPVIFDKFSQIESSLNRNKGGVGLGLTITKQLIDSHLGAIWVDSVEKEGSKFNVLLPLYDEKKAFKMDLLRAITSNNEVGIIKITFKDSNVINELKEKKLITIGSKSKEILLENSYYLFTTEVSTDSFDAYFKTLKENCSNYDIILSKAHNLVDGENIYGIVSDL